MKRSELQFFKEKYDEVLIISRYYRMKCKIYIYVLRWEKLMRRYALLLTLIVVLCSVFTMTAPQASAHSLSTNQTLQPAYGGPCWNSPSDANCTGQDPQQQGCTLNAQDLGDYPITITRVLGGASVGTITMWWSAQCQSNWVVVDTSASGYLINNVDVYRGPASCAAPGSPSCTNTQHKLSYSFPTTDIYHFYTDMVWAPNGVYAALGNTLAIIPDNSVPGSGSTGWH